MAAAADVEEEAEVDDVAVEAPLVMGVLLPPLTAGGNALAFANTIVSPSRTGALLEAPISTCLAGFTEAAVELLLLFPLQIHVPLVEASDTSAT